MWTKDISSTTVSSTTASGSGGTVVRLNNRFRTVLTKDIALEEEGPLLPADESVMPLVVECAVRPSPQVVFFSFFAIET